MSNKITVDEFSRDLHNDITTFRVKKRLEEEKMTRGEFMKLFLEFIRWPEDKDYYGGS